MDNKLRKINKLLKKIITISLFLLAISLSYAYFTAQITGSESTTTITVGGGTMDITFDGGSNITMSNMFPRTALWGTKTFMVTGNNTTDLTMYYNLTLEVTTNTFTSGALKYTLTSTNTGSNGTVVPSATMQDIDTGTVSIILGNGTFIGPTSGNKAHSYTLDFYFPDTGVNQNENHGKTFNAYVKIEEGSVATLLSGNIFDSYNGTAAIVAKGNPDFSVVAPKIATYSEVTDDNSRTSLGGTGDKTFGTGYTFNSTTGRYTLTEYVTVSGGYSSEYINWYTCGNTTYSNCTTIYKIRGVNIQNYATPLTVYTSQIATFDLSDTGMYAAEDDYGISYYFRGAKDNINNNIIFAGFQWKIIRINGDGSIRLIYNGTCPNNSCTINSTGLSTQIGTSKFNATSNDAKYEGFMYSPSGTTASTSRAEAVTNVTSSTIKTYLDNWYLANILGTDYEDYISDTLFCNDRQLRSELGGDVTGTGYGTSSTYYATYYRIVTTETPNIKCGLKNDRFTVSDTTIGNGNLTYPIGLITTDEAVLAGIDPGGDLNQYNYIYNNLSFWTLSPDVNYSTNASIRYIGSLGYFYNIYVNQTSGVRPVVSIDPQTLVIGTGTTTDPYVVK